MTNFETSTDAAQSASGVQPWHFYFIASMAAATWAVLSSRHAEPAALAMLSAAILAAGVAGAALHHALAGFFGLSSSRPTPIPDRVRAELERDKTLVLRAIKDLEFDRAMGKVSDRDFADLDGRLRARALAIMTQIDATPRVERSAPPPEAAKPASPVAGACAACGTSNDVDARFCKQCGARLA